MSNRFLKKRNLQDTLSKWHDQHFPHYILIDNFANVSDNGKI